MFGLGACAHCKLIWLIVSLRCVSCLESDSFFQACSCSKLCLITHVSAASLVHDTQSNSNTLPHDNTHECKMTQPYGITLLVTMLSWGQIECWHNELQIMGLRSGLSSWRQQRPMRRKHDRVAAICLCCLTCGVLCAGLLEASQRPIVSM